MIDDQGFPPRPGSVIDEKFVVSDYIGSGGTGVVLAAHHRALGRLVAIKFLLPEFAASTDNVQRFLREARATSHLRSEHVVGIIDTGTLPNGIPYFVMEHLTGIELGTLLTERGPLAIDDVLDYVLQALEALAEAHRQGIVHRDLKPANLLLTTREDDSAFIKVLDFGTSKLQTSELTLDRAQTRVGALLGSPLYMSPEQIRDCRDVDARSDIWSVGVLMHELLTGYPPFKGHFLGEIIGAICGDDYAAPAREDLPFELAEILRRCLQKEREDRFQSVEELARAFIPIIGTVACQVSIERILRVPSSAPPPRPDAIGVEALGGGRYLVDRRQTTSSVAPHAADTHEELTPKGRRNFTLPISVALVAAAGVLTWLNLSVSDSAVERSAAAAAPLVAAAPPSPSPPPTVSIVAEPAPTDARRTKRAAGKSRPGSGPEVAAPSSRAGAARAPAKSTNKSGLRALDRENPFAP